MSKFIAMLKDSYKEAVDGWIFLVMLILAGVITLLTLSISVEPMPADVAIPRMLAGDAGGGPPGMTVRGDRGHGSKPAIFFLNLDVSETMAANPGAEPWAGPVSFTATFKKTQSGPFAPAGVIFELGEERLPRDAASLKDLLIVGDPFKEAVRYWATPTGGPKPAYTEELAREFVAAHIAEAGRLSVTEVKRKAAAGGLLGAAFGSGDPAFAVTTGGAERVAWHTPRSCCSGWCPSTSPGSAGRSAT